MQAQIVGAVLTTISFFAFFYGGMKTFSLLGTKSSNIVPAGVRAIKVYLAVTSPRIRGHDSIRFHNVRGTNRLRFKVSRLEGLMVNYQYRKGWR